MRSVLLSLLLIVFCISSKSEVLPIKRKLNENYVLDNSNYLSLKLFGIVKSNEIKHVDNSGREASYKPNEDFNLGFGVNYKSFGLNLAFNFPFINSDNDRFGETHRFDIQSKIYRPNLAIDINFQTYKGYYASNAKQYVPDFKPSTDVYPTRPDIRTINFGANAQYILKHDKFSYRSAFVYNERQLKSAGSVLLGAYFNFYRMTADSNLIPNQLKPEFNPSNDFRKIVYLNFGISGGYAHTFVFKTRWFLSMSASLLLGPEVQIIPRLESRDRGLKGNFTTSGLMRVALGRNSETWFYGMSLISQTLGGTEGAYLERSLTNFKLFIGKRFNPPAFLKKK